MGPKSAHPDSIIRGLVLRFALAGLGTAVSLCQEPSTDPQTPGRSTITTVVKV